MLATTLLLLLCNTAWAELRALQDEAVLRARAGDTEGALVMLGELRADYPDNASILHDEITVRAWQEDDIGVLQAAERLRPDNAPASVLGLVAKAARNLRDFPQALHWYDAALAAAPEDTDLRRGLAMTLADAERPADARNALRGLPSSEQQGTETLLVSAYLFQREGFYLPALNEYDRVLEREPDNRAALRGRITALQSLLLPAEALNVAQQHPGLLTPAESDRLEVEALGLRLRRAIQLQDQRYPYTAINQALAAIDDRLSRTDPATAAGLRLRYDRIVGRTAAFRTLEAIADYEGLQAEQQAIPAYVHFAAARGYGHRQRPEQALTALETAEQQAPDDLEIQFEKFYALVDLERHHEAMALADGLVATLDPLNQEPDSRVVRTNPAYLRARVTASMSRAYADQLAAAQEQLEALLADAPNNRDIRYSLANVYRYRGLRDRPLPQYAQVLTLEPDLLAARVALAQSRLDRQEFPAAEAQLNQVQPLHPSQRAILELNKRWLLHDSWHLIADARWGESSGQTFGSDQHDVNLWLYTPPVADHWRFYARSFDTFADFSDGADARRRAALGTEYRAGRWNARLELTGNRSEGGDMGIAARADRRLNDAWSMGATLEYDSYATPIRAERAGIRSDLAVVDVSYRQYENFSAGAGLVWQSFSDDNNRNAVFANTRLRLLNGTAWKVDGLLSSALSRNSRGGETPYFAPESDFEVLGGAELRWRQFRRFDRSVEHRLTALAGNYSQENFGGSGIWTLAYELNWNINESVALAAGTQRARRVYDGNTEYQTFFNLRLDVRF